MRSYLILLLIPVLLGCRNINGIPESIDYGKVENGVYTNSQFGFKLPVPNSWTLNQEFQETTDNTLMLFQAYKYHLDSTAGRTNPSVTIMAEYIADQRIDLEKYLDISRESLLGSTTEYDVDINYEKVKIGGRPFRIMHATTEKNDLLVRQDYNVAYIHGYVLIFLTTFVTDEDGVEMIDILRSINFSK